MTQPLTNEHLVVTGDVPGMSRAQAQQSAAELGAQVTAGVTAKTTLVVAGAGAGSKLDKAKQLGLRILDAAAFAALVSQPDNWDGQPVGAVLMQGEPEKELAQSRERDRELRQSHSAADTSFSRHGQWTVIHNCSCKQFRCEAPTRREAQALHREHWLEHNPGEIYPWESPIV